MSDDPQETPGGFEQPHPEAQPDPEDRTEGEPEAEAGVVEAEDEAFDLDDVPGGARSAVEAVVMVVDQPVSVDELASALELSESDVEAHLHTLAAEYDSQQRGFALREINGAWRVYSRPDLAPVIEKFLLDGRHARLTQASLETLAVIAYRQPISRARVSAVRGVNVDGVVRTLLNRGLIHELGQDTEGGAMLYGTTPYFLQRIGLGSLEDLPPLAPYLPDADLIDELAQQGRA